MGYEYILVEKEGAVGIVTLNRPKVLNALNPALMKELAEALETLDGDPELRVIILTGGEENFAAGADIKEMVTRDAVQMMQGVHGNAWQRIRKITKPMIAAVSGYALGGGCELVMCCDIVIASESAKFGQPEIKLGIIPGAGGTQRLPRVVGKHRAMEMVLLGNFIDATQAERWGLVNRVVPKGQVIAEAKKLAAELAKRPPLAVKMAKQAILHGLNVDLESGLVIESQCFNLLFATEDKTEGMKAFIEKREAHFKGQ
jgi:enoyl-CoA hydratase